MRLEVLVGNDEPSVYPLTEPKTIVGSGESSHIMIPASAGVSKKHVQISIEDDVYYVTDLGSTNGSFINEERLVPGRRTEFTSFFPVRLGDSVLISLLSDKEMTENPTLSSELNDPPHSKPPEEKSALLWQTNDSSSTRVISLKDLQKAKTETLVKKRDDLRTQKKKTAPLKAAPKVNVDDRRMKKTILLAAIIVGGAFAYKYFSKEEMESQKSTIIAKVNFNNEIKKQKLEVEEQFVPQKIADNEIPSTEELQSALSQLKCTTEMEARFCKAISDTDSPGGVVESIGKFTVLVPEKKWFDETLVWSPLSIEHPRFQFSQDERLKLMALIFFSKNNISPLLKDLKDKKFYFVFYAVEDLRPVVSSFVAIRAQELSAMLSEMPANFESFVRSGGTSSLALFEKYYVLKSLKPVKITDQATPTAPEAIPTPASDPLSP